MSIITVGGIKGGSGKTTIAVNITIELSKINNDILLVDADDQESATEFTKWRNNNLNNKSGYTAIKLSGETVRTEILKLKKKYDYIIIDTGGRDTASQRAALSASDVYLVPFVPRSIDIWTVERVENLIKEMKSVNTDLLSVAFINKADPRGKDNEEAATIISEIENLNLLNSQICSRKSYCNSITHGLGISEHLPKDHKANQEFVKFMHEIKQVLKN